MKEILLKENYKVSEIADILKLAARIFFKMSHLISQFTATT